MKRTYLIAAGIILLAVALWIGISANTRRDSWTESETTTLRSLWIGSLPPLPPDPSNAYAEDSAAAVFGQRLFFDTRFSSNGAVSCATCHIPGLMFTDGLPLAHGVGTTSRKTMTIVGTAYSPWMFWDGRKDSQWAQALAPMESAVEHGGTRTQYAHLIDEFYRTDYEAIFGELPDFSDQTRFPSVAGPVDDEAARAAWEAMSPEDRDTVTRLYANMGKAIAAYERLIMPGPSRFDKYVEGLLNDDQQAMQDALTKDEVAGLRLFIGQAQCIKCHNGPLFTNNDFHNTGVPAAKGLPVDDGRASGVQKALADEFNCLSQWSDAGGNDCAELRFVTSEGEQLLGAFKPPTLRNVAETGPYMHAGQFATLEEVILHYNTAAVGPVGHTELEPLHLNPTQREQLEALLRALSGPLLLPPELLQAPR
ncbi:MAG: cytochrome-c peroxidase [Gallionellales bacterium RBG_16_56_9]|nr:MAG: cytochrome-c peroxidase [Gallionellales bacterium RBG_16_56_9]